MTNVPSWIWLLMFIFVSGAFILGFMLGAIVTRSAEREAEARRSMFPGLDESGLKPGTKHGAIGAVEFADGTIVELKDEGSGTSNG